MSPVPFARRERLISAVGPDGSGSNPGSVCNQVPEKSGMDLPLCPKAGVANAAANVSTKEIFRHCKSIGSPPLFMTFRCVQRLSVSAPGALFFHRFGRRLVL